MIYDNNDMMRAILWAWEQGWDQAKNHNRDAVTKEKHLEDFKIKVLEKISAPNFRNL